MHCYQPHVCYGDLAVEHLHQHQRSHKQADQVQKVSPGVGLICPLPFTGIKWQPSRRKSDHNPDKCNSVVM